MWINDKNTATRSSALHDVLANEVLEELALAASSAADDVEVGGADRGRLIDVELGSRRGAEVGLVAGLKGHSGSRFSIAKVPWQQTLASLLTFFDNAGMKPSRARYITGSNLSSESRQLEVGLGCALQLAFNAGAGVLVTCSMLDMLKRIQGSLEQVLGPALASRLCRDHRLAGATPFEVLTDAKMHAMHSWSGVVLMVYPTERMLDHVGEMHGVSAEICVPWDESRTSAWRSAWNPIPLGTAVKEQPPLPLPKQIRCALDALTATINLNNHLATERDRNDALRYFATIVRFEPDVESARIRAYLVADCGWDGKTATEAQGLFDGIRAGKRYRGQVDADERLWSWIEEKARE
jgi:hypothetical protein